MYKIKLYKCENYLTQLYTYNFSCFNYTHTTFQQIFTKHVLSVKIVAQAVGVSARR